MPVPLWKGALLTSIVLCCGCRDIAGYRVAVRDTGLQLEGPRRDAVGDGAERDIGPDADLSVADVGLRDSLPDARPDATPPDLAAPDSSPPPSLTPALSCASYQMPQFSKACVVATDCVAVEHVTDCCGNEVVWGIAATASGDFANAEAACKSAFQKLACTCPTGPPTLEDNTTFTYDYEIELRCDNGACTTAHLCGAPCSGGLACFRCGAMLPFCDKPCASNVECTKPAVCRAASNGGNFCSAVSCP